MAANKQPMQNENQWHKFLRDECENLKRLGIHFEGQGTTMSYIAEKWQIEKADAAKVKAETATDRSASIQNSRFISYTLIKRLREVRLPIKPSSAPASSNPERYSTGRKLKPEAAGLNVIKLPAF